jgi:lipoprotein NlpD
MVEADDECVGRVERRDLRSATARALRGIVLAIALALAACSSAPSQSAKTYTVKRGDTLYSIAKRHGVDYRDLARWNGIGRDYRIYPGQVLRLSPGVRTSTAPARVPSSAPPSRPAPPKRPSAPAIPWQWPVDGGTVTLTERPNGGHGLTITGKLGQEIRAASGGRVVYLGTGLRGYGQLLIIKHNDTYLSAYGHTQTASVKEGDAVVMGQRIATMGAGPGGVPMLYFEIRDQGAPTNPLNLLPKR